MVIQLMALAGSVVVGLGVFALLYLLGMRAKSPLVHRPLIGLQRAIINPRQLRSAGTPGAYASVVRHRGRSSGRSYETPVGAVATDDGFVIGLPYGPATSWVRNVLAGGPAAIVHEGSAYEVDQPDIVPMATVEAWFPAGDRRTFRWFAVDQALRVRRVEPDRAPGCSVVAPGGDASGPPVAIIHGRASSGRT